MLNKDVAEKNGQMLTNLVQKSHSNTIIGCDSPQLIKQGF
jgi:hypothetical protein